MVEGRVKYCLTSDEVTVFEIEKLGVGKDAPKSERYQWYIIPKDCLDIVPLKFVSMDVSSQLRIFEDAELVCDPPVWRLTYKGSEYQLTEKHL